MTDRYQTYYQRDDLWAPDVVTPHGAVAREIIELIPKDARSILDVGCGNGAISNAIDDRLVIGSDIALAAIKHMRHPACVADIGAMPFADGSFDLVMATDVLEHIPDDQYARACAEIVRVSRRWILIAVPYRELLDSATVECASCGVFYHVHWHQRAYDEAFLRGHWAGLAAVSRWGLAGERWIWTSQAILDLKHAATGRNYDFPQAVCPECGTVRGDSPQPSFIEREFESLHYSLVEAGAALRPPKSEILALFDKQAKRHAVFSAPSTRPCLPSEIRPRDLPRRENPEAYPDAPYVTDVRRDSFVLVLPVLPKSITCEGVSGAIFDAVEQSYSQIDLTGREDLPDARPVRFGYLLRFDINISACPAIVPSTLPRPLHLLRSGSGAADITARVRTEFTAATSALERRREAAEQAATAAMRSAATLEARVASLERQAEEIEARRKEAELAARRLSAVAKANEAKIASLLDACEQLEAKRAKNETQIEALIEAAETAERNRQSAEQAAQSMAAAANANEARINLLLEASERIESARMLAENAALQARTQRDQLAEEVAGLQIKATEATDRLRQASLRESSLRQRLASEGSVDRPSVRDILRRYRRTLVETLDWLTIRRAKQTAKPWPSQVVVLSHMYPRSYNKLSGIFVHEQVKALREQGIDVRVISGEPFWITSLSIRRLVWGVLQYRRSQPTTVDFDGVPVTYFPWFVGTWVPHWAQAWTYSHGLSRIWRDWAKDKSIGIVHAHTSNLDGTAARVATRRTGARLLLTEHMGPFDVLTKNPLKRRKTRASVRVADRVFAVSTALRSNMIRSLGAPAHRVEVLGNGVDLDLFVPAADTRPTEGTRALWIGHHVEVKRVDRLLSAFARALAENSSLTLSLLGDGELLDQAKAQARALNIDGKVTFLPSADRAGVKTQIQAHDYVVISSETETFGLVALEAMACGKPVLSTACGGPQDLIVNDRLGLIVENSEEGLANGLLEMARRAATFEPGQIRSHVERTGSWRRIAQSLTEAYAAALERGR